MCGRYRRRFTKEMIAELFEVEHGLEELEIEPEDDIASGGAWSPPIPFFEWTHNSARAKAKLEFVVRDGAPFGMAGLWSPRLNPRTGQWEQTFSILTGEANEVMQPIHSRQPEILSPHDYSEYLAPAPRPPLHLLRILPGEEMKAKSVTEPKKEELQQGLLFDDGEESQGG
jgi:putative SOS response-associated peptidase YedK